MVLQVLFFVFLVSSSVFPVASERAFVFFGFVQGARSRGQGDSLFVVDIESCVLQCVFNRRRREASFRRGETAISQAVCF